MTNEELIKQLNDLNNDCDCEKAHRKADGLLLEFINDEEITDAFDEIEKWYE